MLLRHPTPDLQSLQGAYVRNVERLEQSAERLSMSSDIGEELRKIILEQRRSESRASSALGQVEDRDHLATTNRHTSHGYGSHASDSIISTNNVARSGGFSPSAYFASPRSSIRSGWSQHSTKGRSASQGSRLAQLAMSEQEARPLESKGAESFIPGVPPPEPSPKVLRIRNNEDGLEDVEIPRPLNISPRRPPESADGTLDRPATAASTATSQQANGLFNDFDGVHIEPHATPSLETQDSGNNDATPNSQGFFDRAEPFVEPPHEKLVYYPAPVPMMLNLPQRLSKIPSVPQRDKRRSEILSGLPVHARKSAAWLPDIFQEHDQAQRTEEGLPSKLRNNNRRTMNDLPPQLRASVFFDYPAARQNIEVKGESAVETLDSILDASAFAPVSAFTDHPIVGHVGAEIYSKPAPRFKPANASVEQAGDRKGNSVNLLKKRNSASELLDGLKTRNSTVLNFGAQLGKRKSSGRLVSDTINLDEAGAASLHSEETPLHHLDDELSSQARGAVPEDDIEYHDAPEEFEVDNEYGENGEHDQYSGQPTTLLAELQLRKQQQKQRNRTAATAFPDGMQSTLLELDAVAHVQRQSRKQKHVKLAWEDDNAQPPGIENQDHDDVPLGMLFPRGRLNVNRLDEDRPLGLIARREMEDNEPLSHRRARLRGEDPVRRNASLDRRASMYTLNIPGFTDAKEKEDVVEIEGETLAQRRERLRNRSSTGVLRPVSGDFASEVMSHFGGLHSTNPANTAPTVPPPETPDLEEETLAQRRQRLQAEGDAKPAGVSSDVPASCPPLTNRRSMADLLQVHPAAGARASVVGQQTQWTQEQQRASTKYITMASRLGMLDPARNRASLPAAVHPSFGLPYAHAMEGAGPYPNPMLYNAPVPYNVTGLQLGQAPLELNPKQRDMIDRWRQSVMH